MKRSTQPTPSTSGILGPAPLTPVVNREGVPMNSRPFTVAEAQRIIHDPELTHGSRKIIAAAILMEDCERDPRISFADMLRCLDYGGTIAEMGARCLYVRTGRDGLGWGHAGSNGLPFVLDRRDWELYLHEHY